MAYGIYGPLELLRGARPRPHHSMQFMAYDYCAVTFWSWSDPCML
jgi:hypothetical protein